MRLQQDNTAIYEQESLWSADYLEDSYYRTKVELIKGMTPQDVRTILDVGCGNGAILKEFVADRWVIGGDRSWAALQYLKGRVVQTTAESLPFQNGSFDMVMSHQMLEHLPDSIFQPSIQELMRVSRRYLLVSVPYRDRIQQHCARCQGCGCVYNVWGHLRTFNHISEVRQLFPGFELRVYAFCGRENVYVSKLGLWLRQRLGGRWAWDPQGICPQCESREQYQAGFPRRGIAALVDRIERVIPKEKTFFWLVSLFKRVM